MVDPLIPDVLTAVRRTEDKIDRVLAILHKYLGFPDVPSAGDRSWSHRGEGDPPSSAPGAAE